MNNKFIMYCFTHHSNKFLDILIYLERITDQKNKKVKTPNVSATDCSLHQWK